MEETRASASVAAAFHLPNRSSSTTLPTTKEVHHLRLDRKSTPINNNNNFRFPTTPFTIDQPHPTTQVRPKPSPPLPPPHLTRIDNHLHLPLPPLITTISIFLTPTCSRRRRWPSMTMSMMIIATAPSVVRPHPPHPPPNDKDLRLDHCLHRLKSLHSPSLLRRRRRRLYLLHPLPPLPLLLLTTEASIVFILILCFISILISSPLRSTPLPPPLPRL